MTTQEYVVGFLLDDIGRVALIRKNRPGWQKGRLNGIGGHVEPGELSEAAMCREFHEETGTYLDWWDMFTRMEFPGAVIHFYRRWTHAAVLDGLRSMTDERVVVAQRDDLAALPIIPNLTWLVPLAAYTADRYEPLHVKASVAEVLV